MSFPGKDFVSKTITHILFGKVGDKFDCPQWECELTWQNLFCISHL